MRGKKLKKFSLSFKFTKLCFFFEYKINIDCCNRSYTKSKGWLFKWGSRTSRDRTTRMVRAASCFSIILLEQVSKNL